MPAALQYWSGGDPMSKAEHSALVARTPETLPFWEAAAENRLVLPFCEDCSRHHLPALSWAEFALETVRRPWDHPQHRGYAPGFSA
jgi:hypothetical protein